MNKFTKILSKAKIMADKTKMTQNEAEAVSEKENLSEVEDTDIITQMLTTEFEQQIFSGKVLNDMSEFLSSKSSDYGPVSTVLDVVGKCTGYDEASIPLSEVAGLTRLMTKVVRYMTLRAKGDCKFESIDDTLKDLIGEATRLYTTYQFNKEEVLEEVKEGVK